MNVIKLSSSLPLTQALLDYEPAMVPKWSNSFQEQLTEAPSWLGGNEYRPEYGQPIFNEVPKGALYISVGDERGFVGAALSDAGALTLTDRSPLTSVFNHINIALLQMAHQGDMEHYRHLRLRARRVEWNQFFDKVSGEGFKSFLKNDSTFDWWQSHVRKSGSFSRLHQTPKDDKERDYHGANYLYEEKLFKKIESLAKTGNIASVRMDLNQAQDLTKMLTQLQNHGFVLGALDLSNGWRHTHLGNERTGNLVRAVLPFGVGSSLLILTCLSVHPALYFAYSFGNLAQMGRMIDDELYNVDARRLWEESIDGRRISQRRLDEGHYEPNPLLGNYSFQ